MDCSFRSRAGCVRAVAGDQANDAGIICSCVGFAVDAVWTTECLDANVP